MLPKEELSLLKSNVEANIKNEVHVPIHKEQRFENFVPNKKLKTSWKWLEVAYFNETEDGIEYVVCLIRRMI